MPGSTLLAKLKTQLSLEYNCCPQDFDRDAPVITTPKANPGRRPYSPEPRFFSMATLGGNAVISADPCLHPWLKQWSAGREGIWLFEENNLFELEETLREHGQALWQSHHMYLPDPQPSPPPIDFPTRWYEQEDIPSIPDKDTFSNALGGHAARPDVLAVAALEGSQIIGLAACSADTPALWQIGIDVLPGHRKSGIGRRLVQLLKDEILRRGKIPFYGTATANLPSQRIAASCGFFPAWVEIVSIPKN